MSNKPFSVATRAADLAEATTAGLDVLVVGMGATGAGVALDAASRGLQVAVLDKGDLASGDLAYAYRYGDCATDDARLVLAVVKAARRFGALAVPYAEVTGLLKDDDGRVSGARVRDHVGGGTVELRARHVINATGVW